MVRPRAQRRAAAPLIPPRKPMATVRRVSLFEREVRVRLSAAGVDILFDAAAVLSEGAVDDGHYFGSTMMTIDLARTADRISGDGDAATARRVAELLTTDEAARDRARRIAVAEARRAAPTLDTVTVDVRVRPTGNHLHLDLDVEAVPAPIPIWRGLNAPAARRKP